MDSPHAWPGPPDPTSPAAGTVGEDAGSGEGRPSPNGPFWDDLSLNLFSPSLYFSVERLSVIRRPALFVFLMVFFPTLAAGLWGSGAHLIRAMAGKGTVDASALLPGVISRACLGGLAALVFTRFFSPFAHLGLKLTGHVAGDAGLTYRIVCRSCAGALFCLLPAVGCPAALVWSAALFLAGTGRVHGAGKMRAVFGAAAGLLGTGLIIAIPLVLALALLATAAGLFLGMFPFFIPLD